MNKYVVPKTLEEAAAVYRLAYENRASADMELFRAESDLKRIARGDRIDLQVKGAQEGKWAKGGET